MCQRHRLKGEPRSGGNRPCPPQPVAQISRDHRAQRGFISGIALQGSLPNDDAHRGNQRRQQSRSNRQCVRHHPSHVLMHTVTVEVGRYWPFPGVAVARSGSRVLIRWGARDLVPRVPGRWRLSVFACWFWGAAWLVALTPRSSGRWRVTPFRRRALSPWARPPITVAAAWSRVTFL